MIDSPSEKHDAHYIYFRAVYMIKSLNATRLKITHEKTPGHLRFINLTSNADNLEQQFD